MNTRSFLLSALVAGGVIGLLGNLPVLNLVNCICCIWVWLGGIFAVFLYQRFQHGGPGLTAVQGAGLGAASGIIGALIGAVVYALTSFISNPMIDSMLRFVQYEGPLPMQSGGVWAVVAWAFFFLLIDLVLYTLFAAIGGLIAASVFRKPSTAVVAS